MSKEELVHLEGEVVLIAKGGNFRVKLENGHEVLAKLAGKVRRHRIRVVLGDRVTVAVSPYDPTRGFIVYRQRCGIYFNPFKFWGAENRKCPVESDQCLIAIAPVGLNACFAHR